jgi:pyruvate ferredoxin oxidoreductase gamma subunit
MIEVRWHGRGGQGSFTASKLLGVAAALYGGRHALAFPSFGPERRGAPVLAFTKIDGRKIQDRSEVNQCDYIVVLDETLYHAKLLHDLKPSGRIILNTAAPERYAESGGGRLITADATTVALEVLGRPITNTAMLGALIGVSELTGIEAVFKGMEHFLSGQVLRSNRAVVERVYEETKHGVTAG